MPEEALSFPGCFPIPDTCHVGFCSVYLCDCSIEAWPLRGVWFVGPRASAIGSCQLQRDHVAHSPKTGWEALSLSPSTFSCWLFDFGQVPERL